MTKVSILKRKIIRAYNNKENQEYSLVVGYPENTYFGFTSLKEMVVSVVKEYKHFYGDSLKHWKH